MIVISEAGQLGQSNSASAIARATEIARLLGCRVYTIPPDFDECETAENALWLLPCQPRPTPGVWSGFLPAFDRYEAMYAAAASKNVLLLNSPEQHRIAMEFDLAYPFLKGMTPASVVIRSVEECDAAGAALGYPVFVKGAVQSRKLQGWEKCLASDLTGLRELAAWLLQFRDGSRGRVIVRRLAPLRHQRRTGLGVPVNREYRCFLYRGNLLDQGYYWPDADDFGPLSRGDLDAVDYLARAVAERLPVPYIAVDLGQLEDGSWTVIEVNEAQFSGMAHTDPLRLWSALKEAADAA